GTAGQCCLFQDCPIGRTHRCPHPGVGFPGHHQGVYKHCRGSVPGEAGRIHGSQLHSIPEGAPVPQQGRPGAWDQTTTELPL
ncbi:hypothetical protein chiPu_0028617, partial [Chiloscyllium punctatum]|nr:hypothetical protein [Chiloscyllium punctatum]